MKQLKNSLLLSHCTSTQGVGIGGGKVLQNNNLQAFYDASRTADELSTVITLKEYTGGGGGYNSYYNLQAFYDVSMK